MISLWRRSTNIGSLRSDADPSGVASRVEMVYGFTETILLLAVRRRDLARSLIGKEAERDNEVVNVWSMWKETYEYLKTPTKMPRQTTYHSLACSSAAM